MIFYSNYVSNINNLAFYIFTDVVLGIIYRWINKQNLCQNNYLESSIHANLLEVKNLNKTREQN